MRIAIFTDGIYPITLGGMQKHSFYLAKYFAQKKHYVDLYFGADSKEEIDSLKSKFNSDEISFINFYDVKWSKKYKFPAHYILENYIYSKNICKTFIKTEKPEFIYIQGFAGWYYLTKKENNIPTGINFHGLNMYQKVASFKEKLNQLLFRPFVKQNIKMADYAFSLGGKLTDILKRLITDNKVIEIPIGISNDWLFSNENTKESKTLNFIFIGRYERLKGIDELNEVIVSLSNKYKFNFDFIGPIPKEKQLTEYDNITYHGAIYDEEKVKSLLSESDILVSASWSEGMPTVILEAMARGCAIIATDVGAVSEQVDSSNGILIPPGHKKALSDAMIKFISMDSEELHKMKEASFKIIKDKFLWNKVIEQTIESITNIIN